MEKPVTARTQCLCILTLPTGDRCPGLQAGCDEAVLNGTHCALCPEPQEAPGGAGRPICSQFSISGAHTALCVPSSAVLVGHAQDMLGGGGPCSLDCSVHEHGCCPHRPSRSLFPQLRAKRHGRHRSGGHLAWSTGQELHVRNPAPHLTPCNLLSLVISLSSTQILGKQ